MTVLWAKVGWGWEILYCLVKKIEIVSKACVDVWLQVMIILVQRNVKFDFSQESAEEARSNLINSY